MNRNVAVIGTGETVFRSHHPDKTYVDLAQEAVVAALRDANMEPEEIDAVVYSMAPTEFMGVNDADKWAVDYTWAAGKPFMRIHYRRGDRRLGLSRRMAEHRIRAGANLSCGRC